MVGLPGARFSYGTAGFRSEGSILASTVYRAGVLAALRSLKTGSAVGLMITASHNPVSDNGVKIADPDGGMMVQRWEPFADALANAPDSERLLHVGIFASISFLSLIGIIIMLGSINFLCLFRLVMLPRL